MACEVVEVAIQPRQTLMSQWVVEVAIEPEWGE
jgi:hypothetical protein